MAQEKIRYIETGIADLLPLMQQVFESGGVFTLYPKGVSMLPLIRQGRDAVELSGPDAVKRGDIVLFCRAGDTYVLHRIVGRRPDGFVLCGDNQWKKECGIKDGQVVAKVSAILRDGKRLPLANVQSAAYLYTLPLRRTAKAARSLLGRVRRRVFPR